MDENWVTSVVKVTTLNPNNNNCQLLLRDTDFRPRILYFRTCSIHEEDAIVAM